VKKIHRMLGLGLGVLLALRVLAWLLTPLLPLLAVLFVLVITFWMVLGGANRL
jgi:hypothetical protein